MPNRPPVAHLRGLIPPAARMAAGGLNPTTTGKRYDNGGLPLGARRCSFFHLAIFGGRCQAKGAYRRRAKAVAPPLCHQNCESRARPAGWRTYHCRFSTSPLIPDGTAISAIRTPPSVMGSNPRALRRPCTVVRQPLGFQRPTESSVPPYMQRLLASKKPVGSCAVVAQPSFQFHGSRQEEGFGVRNGSKWLKRRERKF